MASRNEKHQTCKFLKKMRLKTFVWYLRASAIWPAWSVWDFGRWTVDISMKIIWRLTFCLSLKDVWQEKVRTGNLSAQKLNQLNWKNLVAANTTLFLFRLLIANKTYLYAPNQHLIIWWFPSVFLIYRNTRSSSIPPAPAFNLNRE